METKIKNKKSSNNDIKFLIVLMSISLYILGSIISIGFIVILKSYNIILADDDLFMILMLVSWATYCFCYSYLKLKSIKNYN